MLTRPTIGNHGNHMNHKNHKTKARQELPCRRFRRVIRSRLQAPAWRPLFALHKEGAGFGPGQRAGIRRPRELRRGQAGSPGCRSGSTRPCGSGTRNGSYGRCRSRNRPGKPGSHLSGQNPKSVDHKTADLQGVPAFCEFKQWLHMADQFIHMPSAFQIVLFVLSEFFGKTA